MSHSVPALEAAAFLLAARAPLVPRGADLPGGLRPGDVAAAVAVQRAVMASLGEIGGWKVGGLAGVEGLVAAPLPASGVFFGDAMAPVTLPEGFRRRAVEAEVAFRLAADLPVREEPYTREEVRAAIGTAHAAVEVLESRFLEAEAAQPLSRLADLLSHGALVFGRGQPAWQGLDPSGMTVTLSVDGYMVAVRIGTPPVEDLVGLVLWLANEGAAAWGGLTAGQIVTTGSWTGVAEARAGSLVRLRFDGLPPTGLRFAPGPESPATGPRPTAPAPMHPPPLPPRPKP